VLSPRKLLLGLALSGLLAVAIALISQHHFDLQPCPWCILQRLIYLGIALVAGLAWWLPLAHRGLGRLFTALLLVLLATAGAAAALWQHFAASKSQSCNLTLADRIVSGLGLDRAWPAVFEVRASCFDAAVQVLGLPYELWSLGGYSLLAAAACLLLKPQRGPLG
jgi:protein dithiol:quinone oxidoreductase